MANESNKSYRKGCGWVESSELQLLEQPIPSATFEGKWDCGTHANHDSHAEAQYCIDRDRCPNCRDWHNGMGTCEEWAEWKKEAEKIRLARSLEG